MNSLTIKTKLFGAFAFLLLIILSMAVIAENRVGALNDAAVEVRDNWLPSVGKLSEIVRGAEVTRIRIGRYVMVEEPTEVATVKKELLANLEQTKKDILAYEKNVTKGTEDERLYKEFLKEWDNNLKQVDAVIAAREAGDNKQAIHIYNKDGAATSRKIRQLLKEESEFNQAEGVKAGKYGEQVYEQTQMIVMAVSAVSVVLTILLAFTIIRNVSTPITEMTAAMEKLGAGDKTIKVPGLGRGDEIGGMANALQVFKDTAIEAERLAGLASQEQAAKEARQKKIESFIAVFQKDAATAMSQLAAAATEMRSTAESMSATAEETSRQSTAVAAASEEASSSVSTVASAAEELSASITEIERQTRASQTTADQAVEQAKATESTVRGLEEATNKISDVVNLINDIASQTNLLALNATIEAARAGDMGKGFAVVASEVKNLAGQTAKATEEVGAQIATMQSATKSVVDAISKIGETISQMSKMASDISNIVEQQSSAVKEIAHNAQQASSGTQEVSSNIVGVNRAATDTGSAASQVLETAGDLSKQSENLKGQINSFLDNIQKA